MWLEIEAAAETAKVLNPRLRLKVIYQYHIIYTNHSTNQHIITTLEHIHMYSYMLSSTLPLSLSPTHPLCHTHTLSLTHSLFVTHSHFLSHTLFLFHPPYHAPSLSLTLPLSLSHPLYHAPSISFTPTPPFFLIVTRSRTQPSRRANAAKNLTICGTCARKRERRRRKMRPKEPTADCHGPTIVLVE